MIKALIASLLIIVLTGCGELDSTNAGHHHKQQQNKAQKSEPAPDPTNIRETAYLTTVHNQIESTKAIPDKKLVSLGHAVCNDFNRLHLRKPAELYVYVQSYYSQVKKYMSLGDTSWLIGADIAAFCPKYSYIVKGV